MAGFSLKPQRRRDLKVNDLKSKMMSFISPSLVLREGDQGGEFFQRPGI
jgi:hypothetical protein